MILGRIYCKHHTLLGGPVNMIFYGKDFLKFQFSQNLPVVCPLYFAKLEFYADNIVHIKVVLYF